ncbi:uncharacterized protein SPPG_06285 [Spizellomyces punctatus DAOM BR117]|uniref:Right handed beta helix domain-containing protein n=1 Tax=Spizellomyces punctatus (strain DAOM BR117) TaxID=645134 RepID=A0A0L0HD13_SPIPD|nr:uncharacterized protein SPPG_06285 [Spizellomyces punctatus DAOM BR117]KNC98603.1 hypothetical protein SPPG_06285 [Spizellomyces punctatus DAOM BR117]|eukprot:XP_016606643.1 hypothetical protein SPPG_06285 [Spizellomyces punctatus DAOM BR117]
MSGYTLLLVLIHMLTAVASASSFTLHVNNSAELVSGDGSDSSPFQNLDDAFAFVTGHLSNYTKFEIILEQPGDYPLNGDPFADDGGYTFASISVDQPLWLEIVGVSSAVITATPTLASSDAAGPMFSISNGATLAFKNMMLGVPGDAPYLDITWNFNAVDNSSIIFDRVTFGTSVTTLTGASTFMVNNNDQSSTSMMDCSMSSAVYLYPIVTGTSTLDISSMRATDAQKSALTIYATDFAIVRVSDSIFVNQVCWQELQGLVYTDGHAEVHWSNSIVRKRDMNGMDTSFDVFQPMGDSVMYISNSSFEDFGRIVWAWTQSSTTIWNSTFLNNSAASDSRIALVGPVSHLTIDNCTFIANGGGFQSYQYAPITIRNSIFIDHEIGDFVGTMFDLARGAWVQLQNVSMTSSSEFPVNVPSIVVMYDDSYFAADGLTLTGYKCLQCFDIEDAGKFYLTNSTISAVEAETLVFFGRKPIDLITGVEPAVITTTSFFNIQGQVISAALTVLHVQNSTFVNNNGGSLLQLRDTQTNFYFSNCSFTGNTSPENGAVASTCGGTLSFIDTVIANNSANALGGAIFCDFGSGQRLVIKRSKISSNTARVGGAIYSDNLASADQLVLQDLVFDANIAVARGGAWYSSAKSPLVEEGGSIVYNGNMAPGAPTRGTGPLTLGLIAPVEPSLAVYSGDILPKLTLAAYDAYNQTYYTVEDDPILVLEISVLCPYGVEAHNVTLVGQAESLLVDGSATFLGLSVLTNAGNYTLKFAEQPAPGMDTSSLHDVTLPLVIKTCDPPLLLVEIDGSPYPQCRPALCPRGCSPAGACVADGNCTCSVDPSYEGFDCRLKKSVNDSMSFTFANSLVPYTIQARDVLFSNLSQLYQPDYAVVYRSFSPSIDTVVFKYSLMKIASDDFVSYRELQSMIPGTVALLSQLGLPSSDASIVAGDLANIDRGVPGIVIMAIAVLGIFLTAGSEIVIFRRGNNSAPTYTVNSLLAVGTAFLWAYPITDAVEPTSITCRTQILLVPFTLGIILPWLLVKAFYYRYYLMNGVLLRRGMSRSDRNAFLSVFTGLHLLFWAITIVWLTTDLPVPKIQYDESSQLRYWTCQGSAPFTRSPHLFTLLSFSCLLLAISGVVLRRIGSSQFASSIPARQDKMIFGNVFNFLVLGALLVGLVIPEFLNARIQIAVRAVVIFTAAATLVATSFIFRMVETKREGTAGEVTQSMILKIAFSTNQSQKPQTEYIPVKYNKSSLVFWSAAEMDLQLPHLVLYDSESKAGRFYDLKKCQIVKASNYCIRIKPKKQMEELHIQLNSDDAVSAFLQKAESYLNQARKEQNL